MIEINENEVEHDGKVYVAVEGASCHVCQLEPFNKCHKVKCLGSTRKDGHNVMFIEKRDNITAEDILKQIAYISHEGSLIGFGGIYFAMDEVRRLTLPYWDKSEGNKL